MKTPRLTVNWFLLLTNCQILDFFRFFALLIILINYRFNSVCSFEFDFCCFCCDCFTGLGPLYLWAISSDSYLCASVCIKCFSKHLYDYPFDINHLQSTFKLFIRFDKNIVHTWHCALWPDIDSKDSRETREDYKGTSVCWCCLRGHI